MTVRLVEPGRYRVRIAVERQIVAARSDVPDLADDAGAHLVLEASVILHGIRLLCVVEDELGPLLDVQPRAARKQLLYRRTERRHGADVDAGEVRINAERRAAIERGGERLIEESRARLHRRRLFTERLPRHAEARREIELRRVLEEIRAGCHALRPRLEIVEAQKAGDAILQIVRNRDELVAQAVVEREIVRRAPFVLREERRIGLAHVALRVGVRQVAGESIHRAAQEVLQVREAELAAPPRVREAVEVIALHVAAELHRVLRRAHRQRVGELEQRLVVVDRRRRGRSNARHARLNRDRPEMRILGEEQAFRDVDRRDEIVGALRRVDGAARNVQHVRAEEMLVLCSEVPRVGRRRLDKQRMLLMRRRVRAIARHAHEHRVGVADLPVDFADEEVFVRGIDVGVPHFRRAVAEVLPVRNRVEQIEIRLHQRIDGDGARRQDAVVRGGVRQPRQVREREVLAQSLVAAEVEQLVLDDRTAGGRAELVAREWRRHAARIEEVRRVEFAVAQELEDRAVDGVRARLGDRADDAARGAPELRRVVVGLHAELFHRVDAEQDARHARRRLVGNVGDVRAFEEIARHLGTRAADRHLRIAEAAREVARGGAADGDARLQRRELHEASAVQRQLRDLRRRHHAAGDGAAQLDVRRRALHRHLLAQGAELQHEIGGDVAADFDDEVLALRRRESLQLRRHRVDPRCEVQRAEAAARVGRDRARDTRLDVPDDDGDARQHRLRFIGDGARNRSGRGLRTRDRRRGERDDGARTDHANKRAHRSPPFGPTI